MLLPEGSSIFEGNHKLRHLLAALPGSREDYEFAGHTPDCMQAADVVRDLDPDIILMKIDKTGISGIDE